MTERAPFRLHVFGGLSLLPTSGAPPPTGRSTQRRRLALLSVLAAAGARGLSRDQLVALLWPERDTARARHALAQALYALRSQLGAEAVRAGVNTLHLDTRTVDSDVAAFEAALEAGEFAHAADLYAGPFLDGFHIPDGGEFERWVERQRSRLEAAFGRALETLALAAEAQGDPAAAAGWWKRRASLDPLDSGVALRVMRALAAAGNRAGAVRYGHSHAQAVLAQLGIEPDARIARYLVQLREDTDGRDATG